ncbi:T9SS type A sorting domain-containing protein [Algoriphagus halophytocola]|uniref:T9SS type A sorting domain-containing protein n=1 Tax=Algoriphagus halophytocola TaxID=2991499 RepID=UPI0022DE0827|nr:T9SS type A sorting domain-containing protein [Algoriphagus sp. TR-M9]WBL42745.1 T9SS type A sorting domain-containing protein [Algoriphagus sp. TR-M9]
MWSIRFALLSFLIFLSTRSVAQIQTQYAEQALLGERGYFNVAESGSISLVPKVDVQKLLQEDSLEANQAVPFRFGYAVDVNYDLNNSGSWYEITEGKVWKFRIQSPEAFSINLIFDDLVLPEGGEMYLYNEDRTMVYGPITSQNYDGGSGYFSTDLIQGDLITLELFEPLSSKGISRLSIFKVIHGYKNMFNTPNNFGDALACHNNVNCAAFSAWENESNSVAMVLLADNTRVCSGALLNNTCGDMTPNFLTAFHCIDTGNTGNNPCDGETGNGVLNAAEINRAQNWLFRFQYKSPTCTPSTEPVSWVTYNGSTFRAGSFNTDFALVEMNTRPDASTGIQYAGWSRATAPPTSGANIHHPSGDVMKISTYSAPATNSAAINWNFGCLPFTNTTPASTHWTVNLINGTTEGGSSGSPLFDQNRRVVGQLHGGDNGCAPVTKHYGKIDLSWNGGGTAQTRLRDWLDPNNTGAMTTNTVDIPSIDGPDLLCSSGSYTLQNLPAGSTATWTVTPSGQFTGSTSGSGTTATLTPGSTAAAQATLTYTITSACGNTQVQKTFWIGKPSTPIIYPQDVYMDFPPNRFTVEINSPAIQGVTSYNWYLDGVMQSSHTSSAVFNRRSPFCGRTYYVEVEAINDCGTSVKGYYYVSEPSCFTGYSLRISPNPATSEVEIAVLGIPAGSQDSGLQQKQLIAGETGELLLYDRLGNQLYRQQLEEGKTSMDVSKLKPGTYVVKYSSPEGVLEGKLLKP